MYDREPGFLAWIAPNYGPTVGTNDGSSIVRFNWDYLFAHVAFSLSCRGEKRTQTFDVRGWIRSHYLNHITNK